MKKGFLAAAVLLTCITTLHYSSSIQQTLSNENIENENYVKLVQRTQETKYRLTQGFKDSVKVSMKKTRGKDSIIREQLACEELQRWLKKYDSEKNSKTKLKTGKIDPSTYDLKNTRKAFEKIEKKLKEDPKQALGEYKDRAVLCINYLSIKGQEAEIKNNGYLETSLMISDLEEPVFAFEESVGNVNQTVLIPSGTKINVKEEENEGTGNA